MNTMKLIELGRGFLNGKVSAHKFSEDICVERRGLRGVKNRSEDVLNCGGELFMLAEIYNPDEDRADYELDENQLREKVKETLVKFQLL
ncbi:MULTISPECIES: colicin immunity domain-containing protein [Pseudomonas]|uniref:Colicin-D n=1 Tax=Pseudomonas gingeri TaxID=117681 RepID=A0A7Y7WM54_9PSED|nr:MULTISPECIES: colicin immunity domain-containing protein [Pseudomonas]MPQ71567.1 colicin-D [Pseudomonas sp. MWU12-2323]NWB83752.1 colicin-D [Pseudomonas gingeri]